VRHLTAIRHQQVFAGEVRTTGEQPVTASTKPTTTDAGATVASDEHSLTIGADGPIVLNDHYLIEQMANFNRERGSGGRPSDDEVVSIAIESPSGN
jgi:hypothetical protein